MSNVTMTWLIFPQDIWEALPQPATDALREIRQLEVEEEDGWVTATIGETRDDWAIRHFQKLIPTFAAIVNWDSCPTAYIIDKRRIVYEENFGVEEPIRDDFATEKAYLKAHDKWCDETDDEYWKAMEEVRDKFVVLMNTTRGV